VWQETRGYPRSICLLCLHLCLGLLETNGSVIDEPFVHYFLNKQHSYRRLEKENGLVNA
jgi:hypothetical protein